MSTPPPYGLDSPLSRVMSRMLVCACDFLTQAGRPACECALYWGSSSPPMDMTCGCDCQPPEYAHLGGGQVWARFVRIDPLARDLDIEQCAPMQIQAIVEVGVYRCWPTTEDGSAPPIEERNRAAMGLMTDVSLIWSAMSCCAGSGNMQSWLDDWDVTPYVAQPIAPQGGCTGAYIMSYVRGVLPGAKVLAEIAKAGP